MAKTIAPHGGTLVNRLADENKREELLSEAKALPSLKITQRNVFDLEMIAIFAEGGEPPAQSSPTPQLSIAGK